MVKKFIARFYLLIVFIFIYAPIGLLIVLSFNSSKYAQKWEGFTFSWYKELFENTTLMEAFTNTIILALLSSIIATIIGTISAMGIKEMKKRSYSLMLGATNIPLLNADIVTGIAMMLLFTRFTGLSFSTVLISHITFNIPYVVLSVLPKLRQTNRVTYEAALDLGASPVYAFFKTTWHEILPGVLTGFIMSMTMSLNDFAITYFTRGAGYNTLSTKIYTEHKKGVKPEMYALSAIIFVTVLAILVIMDIRSRRKSRNA